MPERNQEVHKPLNRKISGTVAHQRRNMGLLDAQYGPSLRLREMAVLDDSVDLQGKMRLELLALRIGETDVGEDVAAALFRRLYVFVF